MHPGIQPAGPSKKAQSPCKSRVCCDRVRFFKLAIAGLTMSILPLLGGCLWLPIPNRTLRVYGVEAEVVDAATHEPISCAQIQDSRRDPPKVFIADRQGRFRISPKYQWHAAYQFGVLSHPLFPTCDMVIPSGRRFTVFAEGYNEATLNVGSRRWSDDEPNLMVVPLEGDTLKVPLVELTRKPSARQ